MELEDGYIHPYREITLGEMAEHALVYYNFPNPMAYPEYVAPEEVGTYNTDIITAELLAKNTDLPEASCRHLPQWHGVVMDDMELLTSDIHLDDNVYEYEIKTVKDAGFNYICLDLDFNWLQDYQLFNFKKQCKHSFQGDCSEGGRRKAECGAAGKAGSGAGMVHGKRHPSESAGNRRWRLL